MILDFKILSLWFVIEYWWCNTLTRENNWFLDVLVESNFATPTPFGRVSCFVVGICLSNYNLNSFLIHQASYQKGYQWYLMHREVLGSIWKIGRYPSKVSEVLWNIRSLSHSNHILSSIPFGTDIDPNRFCKRKCTSFRDNQSKQCIGRSTRRERERERESRHLRRWRARESVLVFWRKLKRSEHRRPGLSNS